MSCTTQPGSNAPVGPAVPLRHALQQHRQAVAASSRSLQDWTTAAAEEDRALRERLDKIRHRLSTALRPPAPQRRPPPTRPRLRIVGVIGE